MQDMRDNYHGAMADLEALVDEFYRVCPDNKFLRANYPRDESVASVGGGTASELNKPAAAPAYTTEADIEAMAEDAFIEWNPHPPMHSLRLATMRVNQKQPFIEGYIAGASPVHAELARVKVERDALWKSLTPSAHTKAIHIGDYAFEIDEYDPADPEGYRMRRVTVPWNVVKDIMQAIREDAKQALQQKGGGDD